MHEIKIELGPNVARLILAIVLKDASLMGGEVTTGAGEVTETKPKGTHKPKERAKPKDKGEEKQKETPEEKPAETPAAEVSEDPRKKLKDAIRAKFAINGPACEKLFADFKVAGVKHLTDEQVPKFQEALDGIQAA